MKERQKGLCRAYRFMLTAVSFGKDENEALANLMDSLGEPATAVLEEDISYEALEYACLFREDQIAEA